MTWTDALSIALVLSAAATVGFHGHLLVMFAILGICAFMVVDAIDRESKRRDKH